MNRLLNAFAILMVVAVLQTAHSRPTKEEIEIRWLNEFIRNNVKRGDVTGEPNVSPAGQEPNVSPAGQEPNVSPHGPVNPTLDPAGNPPDYEEESYESGPESYESGPGSSESREDVPEPIKKLFAILKNHSERLDGLRNLIKETRAAIANRLDELAKKRGGRRGKNDQGRLQGLPSPA